MIRPLKLVSIGPWIHIQATATYTKQGNKGTNFKNRQFAGNKKSGVRSRFRSKILCMPELNYLFHGAAFFTEEHVMLLQLACRSGLEYRAVELCDLMPSHHVVQLAMKYASKLGKMNLADKVAEVATRKLEEREQGFQNDHVDNICTLRYSILTYSLLQGHPWMWLFKEYQ
jgi:hypothetical protein